MIRNNADARRCSYFEVGVPVFTLNLWVLPKRDEENPLNWLKTIELLCFKMTGWRLQNLMHWLLLEAFCLARVLTLIFGTSFASLSQPSGFSLRKWALPCLASPGLNRNVLLKKAWFSFGPVSVQFIQRLMSLIRSWTLSVRSLHVWHQTEFCYKHPVITITKNSNSLSDKG